MPEHPHLTTISTAAPRAPARTRGPGATDELPSAVDAGLQCLHNLALVQIHGKRYKTSRPTRGSRS